MVEGLLRVRDTGELGALAGFPLQEAELQPHRAESGRSAQAPPVLPRELRRGAIGSQGGAEFARLSPGDGTARGVGVGAGTSATQSHCHRERRHTDASLQPEKGFERKNPAQTPFPGPWLSLPERS